MGKIYLKKKLYGKARQEFERALEIDPNYLPAMEGLEILRALGLKDT